MASWELIDSLETLRGEFNTIAPARDKRSDGAVADGAHREKGTSDHIPDEEAAALRGRDSDTINEVHAIDVDDDLQTPGLSMEDVVQFLLRRCRSGAERRLLYIIYNRRIWSASNGWRQQAYTGDNAHTEHAHFSGSYVTALEQSRASWHLEDVPVALTADDKKWLTAEITRVVRAEVAGVDEAVRAQARNNKEFLSDTEKSEIVDRTINGTVAAVVKALTPTPPGSGS
jgi:hypothetical protein